MTTGRREGCCCRSNRAGGEGCYCHGNGEGGKDAAAVATGQGRWGCCHSDRGARRPGNREAELVATATRGDAEGAAVPMATGAGEAGMRRRGSGGGFGQHPLPWDRTGTQLSPPSQAPRVLAPREAAPKICQDGHEGGHGPAGVLRGLSVSSVSRALCGYGKKSRAVRAVMATATCRQGRTKRLSFFVHLTALCRLSDRDNAMRPLL